MKFSAYIYDPSCSPLKVSNIDVELYDTSSNNQLDAQKSGQIGSANEWGAILNWHPAVSSALEILFKDVTLTYSGNAILGINGKLSGRLDMVLNRLPAPVKGAGGGGGSPRYPSGPGLSNLLEWVEMQKRWDASEKAAVRKLITNYGAVVVPRKVTGTMTAPLAEIALNWEQAMKQVGIELEWVGVTETVGEAEAEAVF